MDYSNNQQREVIETLAEFGSDNIAYYCNKIVNGEYSIKVAKHSGHGSFFNAILDCNWTYALQKADYENKKALQRVLDPNIKATI